ncbi:MAG TPA: LacI family DNA-binding transcriptional regulator [Capsulimonadaceae bacterium]|jgi:DNA-binding LacI/PurR family transcriptional regulator
MLSSENPQKKLAAMVTMSDVAREAGVSPATASVVLNNRQGKVRISESTTRRVLNAATVLGYRRNELARAIGSGKNYVLGYLKIDVAAQELEILEGVLKAATEAGYLLKVIPREEPADPAAIARLCVEQRLAGLVARTFYKPHDTELFCQELDRYEIPCVFVDDDADQPGRRIITSDDELGYRLTIEHLAGLGHTRIAFIAGDSVHRQSIQRKQIYRRMMGECRIPLRNDWIVDSNWVIESTENLIHQLFADRADRPTALVCAGDEPAAVAMRTLWRMGYHVPRDVSVIGYSDFSYAKLLNPPLTTISQPFHEIGRAATNDLLHMIDASGIESEPACHVLPTKLVIRESTAKVPVSLL